MDAFSCADVANEYAHCFIHAIETSTSPAEMERWRGGKDNEVDVDKKPPKTLLLDKHEILVRNECLRM